MVLFRKMKTLRWHTLLVIILLLVLCVGVVAQSMREAQLTQEADAREIQNTGTFVATDNMLNAEDVDKAKVKKAATKKKKKQKKKVKAKKTGKTVATKGVTPASKASIQSIDAMSIDIDREFTAFVTLTRQADKERMNRKKVLPGTKERINEIRDRIVAYCKNKIDAGQLANKPDQVAFYENVARQITARAAASCSSARDAKSMEKFQTYTVAKNKAFNRILDRKKPAEINVRQKAYLEQRTLVILEENMKIFLSIISQVFSLVNQASAAINNPVSYGAGCAMRTTARVASGGSVLPEEIQMLRLLGARLQTNMNDYRRIQDSLYRLTGRPPIKRQKSEIKKTSPKTSDNRRDLKILEKFGALGHKSKSGGSSGRSGGGGGGCCH